MWWTYISNSAPLIRIEILKNSWGITPSLLVPTSQALDGKLEGGILSPYMHVLIRQVQLFKSKYICCTGISLSDALIFASSNPQYGDRLFIDLQV